ncbi:MAG: histidinol-phosphate transaminase [Bacteroidota bacterium]
MSFLKHIKHSVQQLEAYSVKSKPLSPDLIKLNQNENPFDLPEDLKRELTEEFMRLPWNRYPDVFPSQLIESLSIDLNVPMESIIAANGSNELMYSILMAIVSKGTKVLIPVPTFFLYEKIVKVLEGELIEVPARSDLSFDVDAIIRTAQEQKPSLIILNSPNSPTGQILSLIDVERIMVGTDAIILVDEAYIEFADQPSVLSLLKKYDRLIILRTFSKAFSLAGLRIGYLIARPALCAVLLKPKIPFTVNNFSSAVAIKVMQRKDLISGRIQYVKQQKNILYEELKTIDSVKVFSSQTNFLIFQVQKNSKILFENLLSENVLIRDVGSYPMLAQTLRVNAGTEAENRAFIAALKKHV